MKPASDEDAQLVLDAIAVGDPIPSGYASDGANVYVLEDDDVARIEDGGNVMPPDYENPPIVEGAPTEPNQGTKSNPVVGDPV